MKSCLKTPEVVSFHCLQVPQRSSSSRSLPSEQPAAVDQAPFAAPDPAVPEAPAEPDTATAPDAAPDAAMAEEGSPPVPDAAASAAAEAEAPVAPPVAQMTPEEMKEKDGADQAAKDNETRKP